MTFCEPGMRAGSPFLENFPMLRNCPNFPTLSGRHVLDKWALHSPCYSLCAICSLEAHAISNGSTLNRFLVATSCMQGCVDALKSHYDASIKGAGRSIAMSVNELNN